MWRFYVLWSVMVFGAIDRYVLARRLRKRIDTSLKLMDEESLRLS